MTPLPGGLRLVLDTSVRSQRGGFVLIGGSPRRVLRLSQAGRMALADLQSGAACSDAALRLGRHLIDVGIAHARPQGGGIASDVTVAVPVRDRPLALERCLRALGTEVPVIVIDDGSRDAAAVKAACDRHGARLIRSDVSHGPAHARNTAIDATNSGLLAFLDSDCVPTSGWLAALTAHFVDPLVAAVAPRVCPKLNDNDASVRERFAAARSPSDMGPRESLVAPGARVTYVPTAAVVVRRRALSERFDEELRYGEDVDLVWRLHDAGWRIRYEPSVTVHHAEPGSWVGLWRRRWRYGTSAAPLSRRHGGRLAPAVLRPWPSITAFLLLARRPGPALGIAGVQGALTVRRLRSSGVPARQAFTIHTAAVIHTLGGLGRAGTTLYSPALLGALAWPKSRSSAIFLIAASPLDEWVRRRPRLDPLRWAAMSIVDDLSYGLGVWHGCIRGRCLAPLIPSCRPPRSADGRTPANEPRQPPIGESVTL